MKYLISVLFLILSACAQTAPQKITKQSAVDQKSLRVPANNYRKEIIVHTDDENSKKFKDYKAQNFPSYGKSELPPPIERQAIFEASGLLEVIREMDPLDQDLFYLKSLKYDIKKLKREYPAASIESLMRLMDLARQHQASH
jgi:hypothetical protein